MIVAFSSPLLQCASAIIGAHLSGLPIGSAPFAVAAAVVVAICLFYTDQFRRLRHFCRHHKDACWQPAAVLASRTEMDDPLYAALHRCLPCCLPLRTREQGSWEEPEEDAEEPARTERHLGRALTWRPSPWNFERAGDALIINTAWLKDAASSSSSMAERYIVVLFSLQLSTAVLIGVLYTNPWPQTSAGAKALLGILILFQLLSLGWSFSHKANDFYEVDALP